MSIFNRVTDGFVQAFGITAPTPEQRRTATIFINGLLLLILLAFVSAATFLILRFVR